MESQTNNLALVTTDKNLPTSAASIDKCKAIQPTHLVGLELDSNCSRLLMSNDRHAKGINLRAGLLETNAKRKTLSDAWDFRGYPIVQY